jgi:hypothetical protein
MITSINFGPIVGGLLHGRLAAKVVVGGIGSGAPPISPQEAITRINTLFEPFEDRTFMISGEVKNEAYDGLVRDLLEGAYQMGWNRVVSLHHTIPATDERAPQRFPEWFASQMTAPRSLWLRAHINNRPWIRFQPAELIYHMTNPLDKIEVPNEPGKSAMYVHVQAPLTYRDAISFVRDSPHKWAIFDNTAAAFTMPLYPTTEEKNGK